MRTFKGEKVGYREKYIYLQIKYVFKERIRENDRKQLTPHDRRVSEVEKGRGERGRGEYGPKTPGFENKYASSELGIGRDLPSG